MKMVVWPHQDLDSIVQISSGFNGTFWLPYEDLDELEYYKWMASHWYLSILFSIIYLIVIFSIQAIMKNRQRFEIRGPLVIWNLFLAVFSILGALRMNQELHWVLTQYGFEYSLCVPSYGQAPFGLWLVLFSVSKIWELGDTLFIVLRKQPLIFLHYYHHVLTMLYVWVTNTERMSSGRYFVTMNYTVHAFMYTYYALRAMKFRIPRYVNITITTMQTMQMVVGIFVTTNVTLIKRRGVKCGQSDFNITIAFLMYLSYFFLFSWYFYNAYIRPKPKVAAKIDYHKIKNGHAVTYQNGVHDKKQNGVANGVHNGVANGYVKENKKQL